MPGNVHSMQLEHVLRDVQTDRGRLFTDASFGGSSTPSGNRRRQIGRDRRDRAGTRGGGITRNPAMIVAGKAAMRPHGEGPASAQPCHYPGDQRMRKTVPIPTSAKTRSESSTVADWVTLRKCTPSATFFCRLR